MMKNEQRERLVELIIQSVGGCARNWAEIIADYLLKNGVVALPCKVGDVVYCIFEGHIEPCTIELIHLGNYRDRDGKSSNMAEIQFERENWPYVSTEIYFSDIGKTVFLTREEAEKALERSKQ